MSLKTATQTFDTDWWIALEDGRLWVRPNAETGERDPGPWELLGKTGLPVGGGLVRSDEPTALTSVSADGAHLQAVSTDGRLYRATDLRKNAHGVTWTDRWGHPAARGPGLTEEWPMDAGWAVSDSHPFQVKHYEDIAGIEHGVGLGVAHLYRLGPDGRSLHLNDWWLPADWSRQICLPERGTVRALGLSASASTLLVAGADGHLYTRLYDVDTAGENTLLTYSYLLDEVSGTTRALPAEPWARQPDPDGEITEVVTIFQDGAGNDARVLRVEGRRDDEVGFFEKRIDAERWTFVPTGSELVGTPIVPEPLPAPDTVRLQGILTREGWTACSRWRCPTSTRCAARRRRCSSSTATR